MKQKLSHLFLCAATAVLALTSCSEGSYESHQTFFYPQRPQGIMLYADQTSDTTRIYSLDSWTAETEGEWFNVTPQTQEVNPGYFADTRLDITTTPNTTGKNRSGRIRINAYHSISTPIYQCTWLNIAYPYAKYENTDINDNFATRTAKFETEVEHNTKTTQFIFNIYGESATLTSNADWARPKKNNFIKGANNVIVELDENTQPVARNAQFTLTSQGISTTIHLKQNAKVAIK